MQATALPAIVIVLGILVSYGIAGVYGVGIAVMSMLSMAGIVVAIDSFGPITDNAGGIAEMADMPEDVRNVTDPLDAVGNTTKAVTKGYAIGSAALAARRALCLVPARADQSQVRGRRTPQCVEQRPQSLRDRQSVRALRASSSAACCRISSPRFRWKRSAAPPAPSSKKCVASSARFPASWTARAQPDYGTTVDIVTRAALKEMIVPALIPVGVPVIVVLLSASTCCPAIRARR